MQNFEGRTAVITGGASGIGLAVAARLGREGMNLVLADVEEGSLAAAVEKFEADDVPVLGVPTDVADHEAVTGLAAAAAARFGDVHIPRLEWREPLTLECEHFLRCVREGTNPRSDGENGLRVVRVLEAASRSLAADGAPVQLEEVG